MSHISIFDTQFAKASSLDKNINNVIKYLVNNRHIAIYGIDRNNIISSKTILVTPLTKIYEHIQQSELLSLFTFINTNNSSDDIPELLAIPDIIIDTNQIKNNSVLNTLPEFKNKILMNLSHLIKFNSNKEVRINNVNNFHEQIVRGTLVMSYDHSKDGYWLTPNLLIFIAKSYSMTIGGLIKWMYNLNSAEENIINTILSCYVLGQMTNDVEAIINSCNYLGSRTTIQSIIDGLKQYDNPYKLDLNKTCNLISNSGPAHLKKFDSSILIRICGKLGSSNVVSFISLEYPPYFVYLLIIALSGFNIYLKHLIHQHKLIKDGAEFLKNLDTSKTFIPSLQSLVK